MCICLDLLWLYEKCPYFEFFWSVFSRIRTEYGEIRSASPYPDQMRENTDQKNSEYGYYSYSMSYHKFPKAKASFHFEGIADIEILFRNKHLTFSPFNVELYLATAKTFDIMNHFNTKLTRTQKSKGITYSQGKLFPCFKFWMKWKQLGPNVIQMKSAQFLSRIIVSHDNIQIIRK